MSRVSTPHPARVPRRRWHASTPVAASAVALLTSPLHGQQAAEQASTDGWRYRVVPYLWVATLTGDLAADGVSGSTDSGYSFFALENLQRYGSAHFEARGAKWGWFADVLSVDYGDSFERPLVDTALGLDGRIYELGAIHSLATVDGLALVGGARIIDVAVDVVLTPGPDGHADDQWTDPFVGLTYRRALGERWYFDLRADVGGFDVASKSQAHFVSSVGYRVGDRFEVFGGYRYLSVDFASDVVLNLTAEGPGVGFAWIW
jgi:hypothetical protein